MKRTGTVSNGHINLFSPGMKVDNKEPADMQRGLDVPILSMEVMDLNSLGFGDYLWYDHHDEIQHFERKTWEDAARDWDSIEDQLRREKQAHPDARLHLILEGVAEPAPNGIIIYRRQQGRNIMLGQQVGKQPGLYKKITGGLYGMSEFLDVHFTASMAASMSALSEWYQYDQKEEHSLFRRHLKMIDWNPNRHVAALMGMAQNDTGLGVQRCEDLINEYGTVWNVIHEDPGMVGAMVRGISADTIRNLDRKIGRPDV